MLIILNQKNAIHLYISYCNSFLFFYKFQVCFTDESVFAISEETSQYVRSTNNEEFSKQRVVQTVKHPMQVIVFSVKSAQSTGRLNIVEDTKTINSTQRFSKKD